MIALKKILVATDFSPASVAALSYGRELARSFGSTLTIIHVVEDIAARSLGIDGGMLLTEPDVQRQLEMDARTEIDAAISSADRADLKATGLIFRSSTPAAAIVSCAHTRGMDLIVMGTHGRSGFAHLLMGSVSERVVQTAPCPVLTVRHPEHEFVLPDAATPLVAVVKA